ncbi:hypothetical protein [Leuconostoc citreum]|uniref:hypothetical protein n=1 Tax=Leuconostoc citreum TaxID=33964 RepID=UPI0020A0C252|nr:hypothetical protein [Leuconostoc citreum]MCP1275785.1 hypothetical protein [Leuconostoc citreum]
MWLTVVGFGIVIVIISSLILLNQNKAKPESEAASFQSSVKASSSSQRNQDEENQKEYAKEAARMKGHVLSLGIDDLYFTTWSKSDFKKWANDYNSLSSEEKKAASCNFGTSKTIKNDSLTTTGIDIRAKEILNDDFKALGYFETVKDFNKAHPRVDPKDLH